jgi:adenine-specific DNA-methyltransferase
MATRRQKGTEPPQALDRRRELREQSTKPEQLLWAVLRNRRLNGYKFRRQYSVGNFIVDFVCIERKLVIELDGDYHDHIIDRDLDRQQWLQGAGYKVLRFSNDDVLGDVEAVAVAIARSLDASPKAPSP